MLTELPIGSMPHLKRINQVGRFSSLLNLILQYLHAMRTVSPLMI